MLTSEEEYQKRLQICSQCPHIQNQKVPFCGLCGCLIKIKARLHDFACPIGKWGPNKPLYSHTLVPVPSCNSCGKKV